MERFLTWFIGILSGSPESFVPIFVWVIGVMLGAFKSGRQATQYFGEILPALGMELCFVGFSLLVGAGVGYDTYFAVTFGGTNSELFLASVVFLIFFGALFYLCYRCYEYLRKDPPGSSEGWPRMLARGRLRWWAVVIINMLIGIYAVSLGTHFIMPSSN